MTIYELSSRISSGMFDSQLKMLYGSSDMSVLRHRARYLSAAERFSRLYPECTDVRVFSACGRAEIGGNHTDHQHGNVLAAAIDADMIAIAETNGSDKIRIVSEGFGSFTVDTADMSAAESGTSEALVKGIMYGLREKGIETGGLNVFVSSEIPVGCGLASSSAFEILIATIFSSFFGSGNFSCYEFADICHRAENDFYGKSCGIMDQAVCASGGFLLVDLADPSAPVMKKIGFDFGRSGYSLCVTNIGRSHAGLDTEYDAVCSEMKHVAQEMGYGVLGEADEKDFFENIKSLRERCSDREILRAAHFFGETERVIQEAVALENGDTEEFFDLVNESGNSSAELLQNLCPENCGMHQEIPIAIMLSKRFLEGSGAVKIHGGGFGGSIMAFVPNYRTESYISVMNDIFGDGACRKLNIRPVGGYELK